AFDNAAHTNRDNSYAHLPRHKMAYRKCKNEAKMIQAARNIKSSLCIHTDTIYMLIYHHINWHTENNEAKMIQAARIMKSSVYKTQKFCAFEYSKVKLCIHTETIYMPHLPLHKLTYRKCKNEAKMIQAGRIIKSSVYKTQFEITKKNLLKHNSYAHLQPHKLTYRKCKNEAKMIQAARIIKSSVYKTQFEMLVLFVKYKL
uniref:Uncharacterized protein n=1 Tax=Strongyloides stercoralis TaxID=6248 RepID=A0AAF5DNK1_STRER